jgi:hypothetical protein
MSGKRGSGFFTVPIFTVFIVLSSSVQANQHPIGFFDGISGRTAYGWALDPDSPLTQINVHFYVDGPAGQGRFIGSTIANLPRPDVNQVTGYPGDHGFSWSVPESYNGYRVFYAYGIDASGGANPQLTGTHAIGVKPSGNSQISAYAGGYPVVVTTTDRLAGAIGSMT